MITVTNPQLDAAGEPITKAQPGFCKFCIHAPLVGNYYHGLCSDCLKRVPASKREALSRALSATLPVAQSTTIPLPGVRP